MTEKERRFKVAAVQLAPVLFDRDATTEKVLKAVEGCGREGVRLAVFPETIIPNYPYFAWLNPPAVIADLHQRLYEEAVDVPGPVTEALSEGGRGLRHGPGGGSERAGRGQPLQHATYL